MNAGLLGEHLASPRTATKTNQNTALEPKTTDAGEPSSKDEFASLVNESVDAPPKESAPSDTPAAPAAPQTDQPSTPQTERVEAEFVFQATAEGEADSVLTVSIDPGRNAETDAPDLNARASSEAVSVDAVTDEAETANQTRRADVTPEEALTVRDPRDTSARTAQTSLTTVEEPAINRLSRAAIAANDSVPAERVMVDAIDAAVPRAADVDGQINSGTIPATQTAVTDIATLVRDASGWTAETPTPLSAAQTQSAQAATPVTNAAGMTPTAPSITIASPNELTSIILNAINTGMDPREQLVVQLDPPELGRVMIDFKFDAQGLQQIIVTSENPEALKRLREMHFELTQALREQGLSDQNMSFQQNSEDQSQQTWASTDYPQRDPSFDSASAPGVAQPTTAIEAKHTGRDRLDLTL